MSDRTVGQVFTAAGREAVPAVDVPHPAPCPPTGRSLANGAPRNPAHYDYRRAALDALHFPKLCDRFWPNLRRCAGYKVQYFAAIEAQRRLAPHLHAAIRGAIPRAILRQVVAATYYALWWPPFDQPVYVDRLPVWTGPEHGYVDPDTGEVLPTWDRGARPARHRPGRQAGACDAVRHPARPARRHPRARRPGRPLPAKYLTKAIGDTHTDGDRPGLRAAPRPAARRAALAALLARGARTGSATASNPTTPAPA